MLHQTDDIELIEKHTYSWFDQTGSKVLSWRLTNRLRERLTQGRMLALTYDRSEYSDPRELYRTAQQNRHVRRFIEDLGEWLAMNTKWGMREAYASGTYKNPLTGRWVRKLEFQTGGWVHWHLLLDVPMNIPHAVIAELWGHGFVFIQKITQRSLKYFAKYFAKADDIPAWLLLEPIRSVKVIASSPGFWNNPKREYRRHEKKPRPFAYLTIGSLLGQPSRVMIKHRHRLRTFACRFVDTFHDLSRSQKVYASRTGATCVRMSYVQACAYFKAAAAAAPAAAAPLHSINPSNPPRPGMLPDQQHPFESYHIAAMAQLGEFVWRTWDHDRGSWRFSDE